MHEKKAFIFIGQSGCGKGTQIALLQESLVAKEELLTLFSLSTGTRFRTMIEDDSYTIHRTKEYIAHGKLPPSFLGVHAWAHDLIYSYNAEDVIMVDGTPRILEEVPILLGALSFLDIQPFVIHLVVSDAWAYEKTKNRGREDDQAEEKLKGRIAWFHSEVVPVIEFFKKDTRVRFGEINGEQSIEKVHADVLVEIARLHGTD